VRGAARNAERDGSTAGKGEEEKNCPEFCQHWV
jgi:hypothetical protein